VVAEVDMRPRNVVVLGPGTIPKTPSGKLRSCTGRPTSWPPPAPGWPAAEDAGRRRIERDLHDGAQQHLTALAVNLRTARRLAGQDPLS
jgi:histidine kinase